MSLVKWLSWRYFISMATVVVEANADNNSNNKSTKTSSWGEGWFFPRATAAKALLALTSRYGRIISLRWYKTIRLCGSWYYGQFWNITSGIYAKYSEETMLLQILIFHPSTIVPFTLCPSPWCTVRANKFRRLRKLKSWSWFIILQNPPIHWATFIIWT